MFDYYAMPANTPNIGNQESDIYRRIAQIEKSIEADLGMSVATPEHINNSPETAPSKRLEKLIPNYPKVKNGAIISKEIGIDRIMAECKHFTKWIEKIKNC